MGKREGPYTRLKRVAKEYVYQISCRQVRQMWRYSDLNGSSHMRRLYERVAAAQQLGWDVRLRADGDTLFVEYIERLPDAPDELRW